MRGEETGQQIGPWGAVRRLSGGKAGVPRSALWAGQRKCGRLCVQNALGRAAVRRGRVCAAGCGCGGGKGVSGRDLVECQGHLSQPPEPRLRGGSGPGPRGGLWGRSNRAAGQLSGPRREGRRWLSPHPTAIFPRNPCFSWCVITALSRAGILGRRASEQHCKLRRRKSFLVLLLHGLSGGLWTDYSISVPRSPSFPATKRLC